MYVVQEDFEPLEQNDQQLSNSDEEKIQDVS